MSLRHWIWLTLELPAARCVALLDALESPERIYAADRDALSGAGVLKKDEIDRLLASRSLEQAQAVLLRTQELGIQIITLRDAAYPDRLRGIENPPPVLYCKGTLPAVDDHVCMAVVGTRKASAHACRTVERFAAELARAGILIISGMAAGIDSQGHRGALRAGAPTIAVFGCGLDICFPAENRELMERIIENGCILSEYPPGTRPARHTFPARNRIIAGLSMGVLVGAAPTRSGSLITARLAQEQGRDVFVIPGGIDDAEFAGSNECIKEGASLVTQPEDMLRVYRERWPDLMGQPVAEAVPDAAPQPVPVKEKPREPAPVKEKPAPEKHKPAPQAAKEKTVREPAAKIDKPRWLGNWRKNADAELAALQKPAKPAAAPERAAAEPEGALKPEGALAEQPGVDYSALTPNDQRILDAVRQGAVRLDKIIEKTELPANTVISALVILEVEGIISRDAADNVTIV